jgi:ABC-type protease/lipase transport system fused ATPase/permease subunit
MKPLLVKIHTKRAADEPRVTADDNLGRGLDMALTLILFTGLGWLVDTWLGLFPVFTIALLVVAAVGTFAKVRYAYDATMERLEAERAAARQARNAGGGDVVQQPLEDVA